MVIHTHGAPQPSPRARSRLAVAAVSGVCACLVFAVCLSASTAHARREATFNYPYSRVWTTAVRLLRVDFESHITEKDKEDGYFLFEFPERGKNYAGSMELVASHKDDVETVRVVLTIQALPTYVENMLMDRLARKLVQEFGAPTERKPEKKPAPPDNGSADSPSDDGDSPSSDGDRERDRPKKTAPKPARDNPRRDARDDE